MLLAAAIPPESLCPNVANCGLVVVVVVRVRLALVLVRNGKTSPSSRVGAILVLMVCTPWGQAPHWVRRRRVDDD